MRRALIFVLAVALLCLAGARRAAAAPQCSRGATTEVSSKRADHTPKYASKAQLSRLRIAPAPLAKKLRPSFDHDFVALFTTRLTTRAVASGLRLPDRRDQARRACRKLHRPSPREPAPG